jgi:hypothetical protein
MDVVSISHIVATSVISAFFIISAFIILARKFKLVTRPLAPYVIIGSLIFMFLALTAIVVITQNNNPAVPDRRYMQDYQDADKGINKITEEREAFEKEYNAEPKFGAYSNERIVVKNARGEDVDYARGLTIGENAFALLLSDKTNGAIVSDAKVSALVSSVDGVFEKTIASRFEEGEYRFDAFKIEREGRYRVTLRIVAPRASEYLIREIYAK